MSYPKYDFRHLISTGASSEKLLSALILEPWPELIRTWNYLGKPSEFREIFWEAIKYNLATERYSPLILGEIDPEWYSAVLEGCLRAWIQYPIRYDSEQGITIGKIPGNLVLSSENSIHLISHIRTSGKCKIRLLGEVFETGIWMTPVVAETYRLINFLSGK